MEFIFVLLKVLGFLGVIDLLICLVFRDYERILKNIIFQKFKFEFENHLCSPLSDFPYFLFLSNIFLDSLNMRQFLDSWINQQSYKKWSTKWFKIKTFKIDVSKGKTVPNSSIPADVSVLESISDTLKEFSVKQC